MTTINLLLLSLSSSSELYNFKLGILRTKMKLNGLLGDYTDNSQTSPSFSYSNFSANFRAFTDGGNVGGDNIQGILNETDSELSSQSPVDAPNDIIYIVCGVVIAMILVAVIIVLVAITINKLRKREETSSASPSTIEAAQTTTYATSAPQQNGLNLNGSTKKHSNGLTTSVSDSNVVLSNGNGNLNNFNGSSDPSFNSSNQNSVWVFPPLPPQPNIYNCNNNIDAIMQQNEKHGFKGFKKQFSGRFKRFVAKKPQEPAPAIPPELKPQLKTIYVY